MVGIDPDNIKGSMMVGVSQPHSFCVLSSDFLANDKISIKILAENPPKS